MSAPFLATHEHGKSKKVVALGEEILVGHGDKARMKCASLLNVPTGALLDFAYTMGADTPFGQCMHTNSHARCNEVIVTARGMVHRCSCDCHAWELRDPETFNQMVQEADDRRRCRNCGDVPSHKRMGTGDRPLCVDSKACAKTLADRVASDPVFARVSEYRRTTAGVEDGQATAGAKPSSPRGTANTGECSNPPCAGKSYCKGQCANCYSYGKRHGGAVRPIKETANV